MIKIGNKILVNLIICFIISSLCVYSQSKEGEVLTATAKLYQSNSEKSKVILTLSRGDIVNIIETKGDWCKVKYGKATGWVKQNILYIKDIKNESAPKKIETMPSNKYEEKTPTYNYSSERLGLGVRAGLSISSLHGSDAEQILGPLSLRYGFGIGAIYIIKINNDLSFQPELTYMQKGASKGDSTYEFDYIELPLLLRIKLPPLGTLDAHAHIGPSFAYNIRKQLVYGDKKYYYTDMSKFDIGLLIGLGLSFDLSVIQADIDLRYNYGFLNIQNADNPFDMKCHNLFLSLGIIF